MPRGLSSTVKTELNKTSFSLPLYFVRVTRGPSDIFRWGETECTFNDGLGTFSYEPRVISISGIDVSPDEAGAINIRVANVDGLITTQDRFKSFRGSKVELLAYLPDIDEFYSPWFGWSDEVVSLNAVEAEFSVYPTTATPNVQVPKRIMGLACTNVFANTANWVSYVDFDGSECPYQRLGSIGFTATLQTALAATAPDTTIDLNWGSGPTTSGAGAAFGDFFTIGNEILFVNDTVAPPVSGGLQAGVPVSRGLKHSTIEAHTVGQTAKFQNCNFSQNDCKRRGMYGNNTADVVSSTSAARNYFAGFPFITGYQYGTYRSKSGERTQPLRLVFSGNDSAYGRAIQIPYGRCRIADPILLIAKPEGEFLTTTWIVAEGVLASTPNSEDQSIESNAYSKTIDSHGNAVENIYVNGASRHDREFGIESKNGEQDQPQPSGAFYPTDPSDFLVNHLGFWGSARVTLRINTKASPSVDATGQSISGTFEIQFGRLHRVYTSATTFIRRASDDGFTAGASPPMVLLDINTSKRAGGGLDYSQFNLQSFVDAAAYCRALVTNVYDGTDVKRWTWNGIIDQRKAINEWNHVVCQGMYAMVYPDKDGLRKIRMLKAETLSGVPLFSSKVASTTGRNILWRDGHSTLTKTRKTASELVNELRINFVDKSYDPGFAASLFGTIDATTSPNVTFGVTWSSSAVAAGVRFIKDDKIVIDSEKFWIINSPGPPDGSNHQAITAHRAYSNTAKAFHAPGAIVQFTGQAYAKISVVVSDREDQTDFGKNIGDQSRRQLLQSVDLPGVTTADEAARIGTLMIRAGLNVGDGGLSNNSRVTFEAFYRDAEDLELGDIVELEDEQLDPALNERFYRVMRMTYTEVPIEGGGIVFSRQIEAQLHDNAIYDDTAFNIAHFDRIDASSANDAPPPPVTNFTVVEGGIFDQNGTPQTRLTFNFTLPSPLANYRSLVILRSNDDGAGNAVGDWRFVADIEDPGTAIEYEISGRVEHFAALSRALSFHVAPVDTKNADGSFTYPRFSVLVDGMADTPLSTPIGLQAFGRNSQIYLKWNGYTGIDAQLVKRFNIYRNNTPTSSTSNLIAHTDTNWYIDNSDVIVAAPDTTFYYFVRGVSKLENATIAGVVQDGLSPFSAEAHDNPGTDTGLPDAPVINVLQDVASADGNFKFIFGIDPPASPANWDTVESVDWQVSRVSDFSTTVFNRTYALTRPPFVEFYDVKVTDLGTYYFRARVSNIFGNSAWSATFIRSTDYSQGTTDTDIMGEVENLTARVSTTGNSIQGDEVVIDFDLPEANRISYWGFVYVLHDSATLPTPDYDAANSAYAPGGATPTGVVNVGSNILTDTTKSFPTAAGGLTGRRCVIFSIKRVTSGTTHAEEAGNYAGVIQSNTATTLTLDRPLRLSGTCQYYVMQAGGLNEYEKTKFYHVVTEYQSIQHSTDRHRTVRLRSALSDFHAFIIPFNLWGAGKDPGVLSIHVDGIAAGSVDIGDVHGDGVAPGVPTGLTVNAGFRTLILTWTNNATATDLKYTEIWRSTTNNRASATLIAQMPYPGHIWSDDSVPSGATRFYWVRHVDFDGLSSNFEPLSATAGISGTTLTLTITTTEITDDSISTVKVQALSITGAKIAAGTITADKITVTNLSALSADLGTITAGTITGALIRTAATGARIELDSTNGLRAFDSGGTLKSQIPLTGLVAEIRSTAFRGISGGAAFLEHGNQTGYIIISGAGSGTTAIGAGTFPSGTEIIRFDTTVVGVSAAINIKVQNGNGIQNATGNASIAFPSGAVEVYAATVLQSQTDNGATSTMTGLLLRGDGSLRRVSIDNSDLGSGAKRYLYLA